jgi:multimeric flavodoxin WrbA
MLALREIEHDGRSMPQLLIVHHTASPTTHRLFEAVRSGATDPSITGVEVVARPALMATALDVFHADGYVLGTPANLGYISGALKHFFDQIYYPCLDATAGRPFGVYVHGNSDTTGALRAIEMITTGLKWRTAQAPVSIVGEPTTADVDACWELGAALSALLAEGLA